MKMAFLFTAALLFCFSVVNAENISLAGDWQFRIDPKDRGVNEKWFAQEFTDRIALPGAMAEAGYGYDVTADTKWTGSIVNRMWHEEERFAPYRDPENTKILFWLQPEKHYIGVAWYQRDVEVPEAFAVKHITLSLERPHWETQLWVDGQYVGMQNGLSTPHQYDVSTTMTPGKHRVTLRVDNTVKIDVGENAHSVSDNTQSNWNGIAGAMTLAARPKVHVADLQVYSDISAKQAEVHVLLANTTGQPVSGTITLTAASFNSDTVHAPGEVTAAFSIREKEGTVVVSYPLGEAMQCWSEFSPALYRLSAQVVSESQHDADEYAVEFGMREITAQGTQFYLNNVPIFLRGTLECCIFPKTGYPPTDMEEWIRILGVAQAHGLNHIRFHSWCPPEAAFKAANILGVIFQVECAAWAHVGDGKPIDQFVYDEGDRILKHYGNHPSLCLMTYGNEPGGRNQKEYLTKLLEYWKGKDSRRLYTSGSGWPLLPESQYHVWPNPRVHAWGNGLNSRFNAESFSSNGDYRDFVAEYDVPIISHEIGQWCVFPNLKEIEKYTGYLKPKNFEIVRDLLEKNHLQDQADEFLMASGKLQALAYKEEIEAALRTKGFGGFQLLDLHDFPGQGTALVGVLDPFWEEKGYITAAEYHRFSGPSVPLLRMDKCIWTTDETFTAQAEITHYGATPLNNAQPVWRMEDEAGNVVSSGQLPATNIPKGTAYALGALSQSLADAAAPCKLRVVLGIEGANIENDWDLWVYPPKVSADIPQEIHVASELDEATLGILNDGGKVLLLSEPGTIKGDKSGPVPPGFSPIFWNTFWTNFQPPHTLGILCEPEHPALAQFPTEYHSNWQWWDIIHGGQIMILDGMPPELKPIVQVIDDWTTCRRLGIAFEARVNGGNLLVCSADLMNDLDARPVARQLRRSLLDYMASSAFAPAVNVEAPVISELFRPASKLFSMGATATASTEQFGYGAENAIDGNPQTFWHTTWEGDIPQYPHWISVDMKEKISVEGISLQPRQDMNNGHISRYAIYVSENGRDWGMPVGRGKITSGTTAHTIEFDNPVTTRYLKLEAREPANKEHPWATLAELDVVVKE
jgi:hypothetical protein